MEEKEEKKSRPYKVMVGDKVKVWRKDWNNNVFYTIQINQQQFDKTIKKYYQRVSFRKGVDLEKGTKVILKYFFENWKDNAKDPYNPIRELKILDYEIVEIEEKESDLIGNYTNNLNSMSDFDDISIDDNFLD